MTIGWKCLRITPDGYLYDGHRSGRWTDDNKRMVGRRLVVTDHPQLLEVPTTIVALVSSTGRTRTTPAGFIAETLTPHLVIVHEEMFAVSLNDPAHPSNLSERHGVPFLGFDPPSPIPGLEGPAFMPSEAIGALRLPLDCRGLTVADLSPYLARARTLRMEPSL